MLDSNPRNYTMDFYIQQAVNQVLQHPESATERDFILAGFWWLSSKIVAKQKTVREKVKDAAPQAGLTGSIIALIIGVMEALR